MITIHGQTKINQRHGHDSATRIFRLAHAPLACILIAAWTLSIALPVHAASAPPLKGQARTIVGLAQEKLPDGIAITIKGDGSMSRYVAFPMEKPPRLVIDFPGISFPRGANAYQSPDESIKKVRIGRYQPEKTRIVFDFQGRAGVPYRVVEEENSLRIEFVTRKEANSTPNAKIVQPNGSLTVAKGETITFEGNVSGGNEPVMSEWTVSGNGISKTTPGLDAQKFDQEGTFTVTYRVTDRDGEMSADSVTVTVTAPPAPAVAAAAQEPPAQEKVSPAEPAAAAQTEIAPRAKAEAAPKKHGRFSLFFADGLYNTGSVDELVITEPIAGGWKLWSLAQDYHAMLAVGGAYEVTPWLELDLGLSGNVGDSDTTILMLSGGPKLMAPLGRGYGAYLRGGPTFGHFDWDKAPGDFDNAVGWELGGGATMLVGGWNFGLDLGYRDISFDYNLPDTGGVTANDDKIDLSGFSVNFTIQIPL